ncbi:(Fe-S)-binding protein [Flavobacterium sp.]|jgi:heterodisulfide reductase subunit D|uniref:(Fe-S)-binding protein n=1 Tax=Flavobacterium sp. TaxID=239 RepID=UPI0025BA7E5C|nr:(Fe-S)-binding protein [Flavobacterium sp.]
MLENLVVPTMAEMMAEGKQPEILFWVGSAGSFDERAKKITRAFVRILNKANVNFAVLGTEESCTGDVAKRAGNEFLFQMQALMNIELLNAYGVKKIVTCDPHSFNCLKNEYPSLGGKYEVLHHTQFIKQLLNEGKISFNDSYYKGKRITFHDPCYLGRANNEFDAPRAILAKTNADIVEMKRSRNTALCCGAGGAQMFKEPEKGDMEINILRTKDALATQPNIIATGCPYCNTMMTDGVKFSEKENDIKVLDIAEIIANAQ